MYSIIHSYIHSFVRSLSRFTVSLIYFAIAFNTGTLHGDVYINTFLSGATEVPAYLLAALLMNCRFTGRRWTGCIGLVGAAATSFVCIPIILSGWSSSSSSSEARWSSVERTWNENPATAVRIPGRATIPLGSKLFAHIASPVSQLLETGVQKGVFGA